LAKLFCCREEGRPSKLSSLGAATAKPAKISRCDRIEQQKHVPILMEVEVGAEDAVTALNRTYLD
jgi:hypothetical protein